MWCVWYPVMRSFHIIAHEILNGFTSVLGKYRTSGHVCRWSFLLIQVIVIPRYEYDIVVITRVRGEAEYKCQ